MPAANPAPLSLLHRLRLWLVTPIVGRLLLLTGTVVVGYGYAQVLSPVGNLEQVTRQVVGGMLAVISGAALVGAVVFWRD